jgi:hypothetical protein
MHNDTKNPNKDSYKNIKINDNNDDDNDNNQWHYSPDGRKPP